MIAHRPIPSTRPAHMATILMRQVRCSYVVTDLWRATHESPSVVCGHIDVTHSSPVKLFILFLKLALSVPR